MRCPFLREARAGRCARGGTGKQIPRSTTALGLEACSSPAYRGCAVYRAQNPETGAADRCPYLEEPLVQYCSAAPQVKYIPYSELLLSRCGTGGYRYCDLYLGLERTGEDVTAGIRVPGHLQYTANHMWYDASGGDRWHAGIDGFLAKVLGTVERLRFFAGSGARQPVCLVTVRGIDLELAFPHTVAVAATHDHLRSKPELLTLDPYGQGWLFEGQCGELPGLIDGHAAAGWMESEINRLSEYLAYQPGAAGPATCADGGVFTDGVLEHLSPERIAALFEEFFPSHPKGDRKR